MLPRFAHHEEVEKRLAVTFNETERTQAHALLDYASARLRARTSRDWVDDQGQLEAPDLLKLMCVEMVARAVQNPTGATQETTGPFGMSFGSDAAQRIYLTRQEIQDLDRLLGRNGLWTLRAERPVEETL